MTSLKNNSIKLTTEGVVDIEERIMLLKKRAIRLADQLEEIALGTSTIDDSEFYVLKSEKFFIEQEIKKLEDILENSEIATLDLDKVGIGCRAKISNHHICHVVHIVEGVEADSAKGKVSVESPLGKALLGKKIGDKVKVQTPSGTIPYEVMQIL
jgi:transcription elongation factor GreA